MVSASPFTSALYALAQFAVAYALVAQFGLYLADGKGQLVKGLLALFG